MAPGCSSPDSAFSLKPRPAPTLDSRKTCCPAPLGQPPPVRTGIPARAAGSPLVSTPRLSMTKGQGGKAEKTRSSSNANTARGASASAATSWPLSNKPPPQHNSSSRYLAAPTRFLPSSLKSGAPWQCLRPTRCQTRGASRPSQSPMKPTAHRGSRWCYSMAQASLSAEKTTRSHLLQIPYQAHSLLLESYTPGGARPHRFHRECCG